MQLQFILWLFLATLSWCAEFEGWADERQYDGTRSALEKGKERYNIIKERIDSNRQQGDVTPMTWCDINRDYSPKQKAGLNAGEVSARLKSFIEATNIDIDTNDKSWTKITETYPNDRITPGEQDSAFYENAYNPKFGAIAVVDINRQSRESKDVTTVTWATWLEVCREAEANPADLKYLIHYTCRNDNAEAVAEDIFGADPGEEITYYEFEPEPSEDEKTQPFYALLGLDNGTGAMWIPINYQKTLGYKSLNSITAWRDKGDTDCMGVAYHIG